VGRDGITTTNEHTEIHSQQQLFKKYVFYLTTLLTHEVNMVGCNWVVVDSALIREEHANFVFVYETLEVAIDRTQADPREDTPGLHIYLLCTRMCLELAHGLINNLKLLCCTFEWPSLHSEGTSGANPKAYPAHRT
jgi:hypothetical protein